MQFLIILICHWKSAGISQTSSGGTPVVTVGSTTPTSSVEGSSTPKEHSPGATSPGNTGISGWAVYYLPDGYHYHSISNGRKWWDSTRMLKNSFDSQKFSCRWQDKKKVWVLCLWVLRPGTTCQQKFEAACTTAKKKRWEQMLKMGIDAQLPFYFIGMRTTVDKDITNM